MTDLSGKVLQKILKKRIWLCQGQLQEPCSCRSRGKFSCMPYALLFEDFQLILAHMGRKPGDGQPASGGSRAAFASQTPLCDRARSGAWAP
jgi:hypothetical protein